MILTRVWNSILKLDLFYILNLPGQTLGESENQVCACVYYACMIGINRKWGIKKIKVSSSYIEYVAYSSRYLLIFFTFILSSNFSSISPIYVSLLNSEEFSLFYF